jgi:hypothetical protein
VATRVQSHLLPPRDSRVAMTSGLLVVSMPLSCFVTHTECHTVSAQDMADAEELMEKAGSLCTVHPGLISISHFLYSADSPEVCGDSSAVWTRELQERCD